MKATFQVRCVNEAPRSKTNMYHPPVEEALRLAYQLATFWLRKCHKMLCDARGIGEDRRLCVGPGGALGTEDQGFDQPV